MTGVEADARRTDPARRHDRARGGHGHAGAGCLRDRPMLPRCVHRRRAPTARVHRAERQVAAASEGPRAAALPVDRRPAARAGGRLILALLAVLVTWVQGWTADAPPPKTIVLTGDKLTVKVNAVPLDDVLKDVVAPSNGEVRGSVKQPHDVTIDFEDVPLRDGLARLLGDENFVLTYREDGTLRAVTLLGGAQDESSGARIVSKQAQPGQPSVPLGELLQRAVPVPPGRRLALFLGQPNATLQQLLDISLRQDDAALRVEAMRAGLGAIDTQADLKAMVVKSLSDVDDHTLENVLRSLAQDRTRELVSQMATISRTPEIRTRTTQLLQHMPADGSPSQ